MRDGHKNEQHQIAIGAAQSIEKVALLFSIWRAETK